MTVTGVLLVLLLTAVLLQATYTAGLDAGRERGVREGREALAAELAAEDEAVENVRAALADVDGGWPRAPRDRRPS